MRRMNFMGVPAIDPTAARGGEEGLAAGLRDRERYTCRTGIASARTFGAGDKTPVPVDGAVGESPRIAPDLRPLERGCLTTLDGYALA